MVFVDEGPVTNAVVAAAALVARPGLDTVCAFVQPCTSVGLCRLNRSVVPESHFRLIRLRH